MNLSLGQNGKGSSRRIENAAAVRDRWPFGEKTMMQEKKKMAKESLSNIHLGDCRGDMYRFEATRPNGARVVREIVYGADENGNRIKIRDSGWQVPAPPPPLESGEMPDDIVTVLSESLSDVIDDAP